MGPWTLLDEVSYYAIRHNVHIRRLGIRTYRQGRRGTSELVGSTYFVVFVRDQPDISLVYIAA